MQDAQGSTTLTRELMLPSQALARFAPGRQNYLKGRAREVARNRYGFRIGSLNFLMGERTLSEVISIMTAYPIPNTPAWMLGIINLRGNLVPVFDLKRLFDLPASERGGNFILVMDKGAQAVGMLIDDAPTTLQGLTAVADMPPLSKALEGYIPRAFRRGDSIWLELDHRGFFASLGARFST